MVQTESLSTLAGSPFALLQAMETRAHSADKQVQRTQTEWVGVGVRIEKRKYVIPQEQVMEVLRKPATTRVPGSLRWLLGLSNVRGSLFPVVDIKLYCGDEPTVVGRDSRVVLINNQEAPVAIVVDEVFGFRRFPARMSVQETDDDSPLGKFVSGMFVNEDDQWAVLDVLKLIGQGGMLTNYQ